MINIKFMKIIISVFYFLFLSNIAFAESILDYLNKKKKINDQYICKNHRDKSFKIEIAFEEINGKLFVFFYDKELGYDVLSSVRVFKTKRKDHIITSYIFPFYDDEGLGNVGFYKFSNSKKIMLMIDILEDQGSINWTEEWNNVVGDEKNLEDNLFNLSEKSLNHIFKTLDFGEPFEADDAMEGLPMDKIKAAAYFACK
jgi:hypothetical protein